ncbi:sensor histidine kinase [Nocardioides marmoraquaticus]
MRGEGEPGHELLLRELGRINSELAQQRRAGATTLHALTAPTEVVVLLAESLVEHPTLDEVARARVQQLLRSARQLEAHVAELSRGFALDAADRLDVHRVDLVALVDGLVERTRVLAEAKSMRLLLLTEQAGQVGRGGCWVDGDPVKLERALSQVIGNAIKFSSSGTTVSVAVDRGVDDAKVSVTDEGPGISAEGQQRVFEVFHREPAADGLPGDGVGLHLARQVVEGHGGRMSVRSTPGKGSTFLVELPLSVDEVYADHG